MSTYSPRSYEIDNLKGRLEFAHERLRWRDEILQDYRTFYREDIATERAYRREDHQNQLRDVDWLRDFYHRRYDAAAVLDGNDSTGDAEPRTPIDEFGEGSCEAIVDFKLNDDDALAPSRSLTSVRVVAEGNLPNAFDLLPLISCFIFSTTAPLDVAVGRGAVHMTKWLLAHGATPSPWSLRLAVDKGDVALFKVLARATLDTKLLVDLPLHKSIPITTWLLQTHPDRMAHVVAQLSSQQQRLRRDPCVWYGERLKRQWAWEKKFDEQQFARKKARFELWETQIQ